jgi:lipoprotein-releasing system ATP-binding protein
MITVQNLRKSYGALEVLKGVSLEIQTGEIVSVVGPSGAGKTTLLQLIGTLDLPDSGSITINHTNTTQLSDKKLSQFRNLQIGFIFQFHNLLPEFNALENVCLPGFIANRNRTEVEQEARELLNFLGLSHRITHNPMELSGGEQQRVAVARALINKPALILADEPTGNLDSQNAADLHQLFFDLRQRFNQTFVIVTHNPELASSADRTLTMRDGQIIA